MHVYTWGKYIVPNMEPTSTSLFCQACHLPGMKDSVPGTDSISAVSVLTMLGACHILSTKCGTNPGSLRIKSHRRFSAYFLPSLLFSSVFQERTMHVLPRKGQHKTWILNLLLLFCVAEDVSLEDVHYFSANANFLVKLAVSKRNFAYTFRDWMFKNYAFSDFIEQNCRFSPFWRQ